MSTCLHSESIYFRILLVCFYMQANMYALCSTISLRRIKECALHDNHTRGTTSVLRQRRLQREVPKATSASTVLRPVAAAAARQKAAGGQRTPVRQSGLQAYIPAYTGAATPCSLPATGLIHNIIDWRSACVCISCVGDKTALIKSKRRVPNQVEQD